MQILLRSKIPVKYTSEFREIFEVTTRARARVCVCVCERERERGRERQETEGYYFVNYFARKQ